MDVFLGLDLGTTNCKVLAVDLQGQPVTSASAPTPARAAAGQDTPEYDAETLWQVCAGLVRLLMVQLAEKMGAEVHVAGLAIASMGESGVLIDAVGTPLAPIFTWYDRRTIPWVGWWRQRLPDADLYGITGLPADHIYSAPKIQWLRENYPSAFSRGRAWLCLADWITYRLTGQIATSYSLASRTMLFDLRRRAWSKTLLDLAGLPEALLPPALPSGEIAGRVSKEAAQATGLPAGVPVVIGGHDHICAAIAAGAVTTDRVLDSAGTAEAILVTLEKPVLGAEMAASGLCCGCHSVQGRYYLLGGLMGGGVLAWTNRVLSGEASPQTINQLMEAAAGSPKGANGIWFLPYLDGSGPPDCDPRAWGAWLGLRLKHSRADLVRAVVEGVSYSIRFLLEDILSSSGITGGEIRCVGGGTRNPFWQQMKANVVGMPIDTPQVTDVTAQGAALLAALGVGAFQDEAEAARLTYRSAVRYEVQPEEARWYESGYQLRFRKLYPVFRQIELFS
jgi:xylulokinase